MEQYKNQLLIFMKSQAKNNRAMGNSHCGSTKNNELLQVSKEIENMTHNLHSLCKIEQQQIVKAADAISRKLITTCELILCPQGAEIPLDSLYELASQQIADTFNGLFKEIRTRLFQTAISTSQQMQKLKSFIIDQPQSLNSTPNIPLPPRQQKHFKIPVEFQLLPDIEHTILQVPVIREFTKTKNISFASVQQIGLYDSVTDSPLKSRVNSVLKQNILRKMDLQVYEVPVEMCILPGQMDADVQTLQQAKTPTFQAQVQVQENYCFNLFNLQKSNLDDERLQINLLSPFQQTTFQKRKSESKIAQPTTLKQETQEQALQRKAVLEQDMLEQIEGSKCKESYNRISQLLFNSQSSELTKEIQALIVEIVELRDKDKSIMNEDMFKELISKCKERFTGAQYSKFMNTLQNIPIHNGNTVLTIVNNIGTIVIHPQIKQPHLTDVFSNKSLNKQFLLINSNKLVTSKQELENNVQLPLSSNQNLYGSSSFLPMNSHLANNITLNQDQVKKSTLKIIPAADESFEIHQFSQQIKNYYINHIDQFDLNLDCQNKATHEADNILQNIDDQDDQEMNLYLQQKETKEIATQTQVIIQRIKSPYFSKEHMRKSDARTTKTVKILGMQARLDSSIVQQLQDNREYLSRSQHRIYTLEQPPKATCLGDMLEMNQLAFKTERVCQSEASIEQFASPQRQILPQEPNSYAPILLHQRSILRSLTKEMLGSKQEFEDSNLQSKIRAMEEENQYIQSLIEQKNYAYDNLKYKVEQKERQINRITHAACQMQKKLNQEIYNLNVKLSSEQEAAAKYISQIEEYEIHQSAIQGKNNNESQIQFILDKVYVERNQREQFEKALEKQVEQLKKNLEQKNAQIDQIKKDQQLQKHTLQISIDTLQQQFINLRQRLEMKEDQLQKQKEKYECLSEKHNEFRRALFSRQAEDDLDNFSIYEKEFERIRETFEHENNRISQHNVQLRLENEHLKFELAQVTAKLQHLTNLTQIKEKQIKGVKKIIGQLQSKHTATLSDYQRMKSQCICELNGQISKLQKIIKDNQTILNENKELKKYLSLKNLNQHPCDMSHNSSFSIVMEEPSNNFKSLIAHIRKLQKLLLRYEARLSQSQKNVQMSQDRVCDFLQLALQKEKESDELYIELSDHEQKFNSVLTEKIALQSENMRLTSQARMSDRKISLLGSKKIQNG